MKSIIEISEELNILSERVRVLEGNKEIYPTTTVIVTSLLHPPTGLKCNPGYVNAGISWDAVSEASSYIVNVAGRDGEIRQVKAHINGITISNLKQDTEYTVSVISVNGGMQSVPSESLTINTLKNN